ncbi:VWA domain-containing protein [Candidatus Thorarchaeota archaeon]|nr:MAG: VWA domain-containing protein [Candidatus Thorarchaeota archaeon]
MILRAKQGRNQRGLCFGSSNESGLESAAFVLSHRGTQLFADVRLSDKVPEGLLVIDDRIFRYLGCSDNSEVRLTLESGEIPYCSELRLAVSSTKNVDNNAIADAISKRVNDLQDDFEGLILQIGQELVIERLGICFQVLSFFPKNEVFSAARIAWNHLEEIHLDPKDKATRFNLCCVVEVGAAAQQADIDNGPSSDTSHKQMRYKAAIAAIESLAENYSNYDSSTQFCGFAYSDEAVAYQFYDSQTGESIHSSSLHSPSVLIAFVEWLRSIISSHEDKTSNPGDALRIAIEVASTFQDLNNYPTIILFCSSGVHSAGPNPVKTVKRSIGNSKLMIFSLNLGLDRNLELMEAIAGITNGKAFSVKKMNDVNQVPYLLNELSSKGSDA